MTGTGVMPSEAMATEIQEGGLERFSFTAAEGTCPDRPPQAWPPRPPKAIPLPLESQLGQDHSGRPAPWGGVRWGSESGLLWGLGERDGAGAACSLQQHLLKHCAPCPQVLTQQPNSESNVSGRDLRVGRRGGHWPG